MNANALYEAHKELVDRLRKNVEKASAVAANSPGAPSASQGLKDATTAYSMAVDKLLSFHSALTLADGSTVSSFGFKFTPESIVQDE